MEDYFPVKSEGSVLVRRIAAIIFCWEIEQNCYQSAGVSLSCEFKNINSKTFRVAFFYSADAFVDYCWKAI